MPIKLGTITIYSLMELSKRLKVTTHTLRAYIKEGKLRGRKVGGRWYVSEDSLRVFLFGNGGEHFEKTMIALKKADEKSRKKG